MAGLFWLVGTVKMKSAAANSTNKDVIFGAYYSLKQAGDGIKNISVNPKFSEYMYEIQHNPYYK